MKRVNRLVPFAFLGFSLAALVWGQSGSMDWKPVADILGRNGIDQVGSLQVLFPRLDLNVVVKGVPLEPEELTSWFLFKSENNGTILVGDMVLLDTEVSKAMAQALRNGLEITALYSPFLEESPRIKRLRVRGKGAKSNLAWAVKLILSSTGTSMGSMDPNPTPENQILLDWSKTEAILGPGAHRGRVLQFEIPQTKANSEKGIETQWKSDLAANLFLQKTGKGNSAAMGTFDLPDEKANEVIETLSKHHFTVTSFRSQSSYEGEGFFFLNFWVVGSEEDVAEGLKDALDQAGLSQDP